MSEKSEAFDISKVLSSKETYNDPSFYEVAQWHIRHCEWCKNGQDQPPPAFGTKDNRHCPEYYEIAEEYSEYEKVYVKWGNP